MRESVISQDSSKQRKGRTGRTCEGAYFPLVTESMFEQLPEHNTNNFLLLPPHIPVLNFLSKRLPADEILMIQSKDYTKLTEEMTSMGLIVTQDGRYIVTELGDEVTKYPFPIHATSSILNAMKKFNVSKKDFDERNPNFYKLLHFLIGVIVTEASSTGAHVFYIPKEHRKERQEFIRATFKNFVHGCDISVCISIFCEMMEETLGDHHGRNTYKKWCKNTYINAKFIERCISLFNQVWYNVFSIAGNTINDMCKRDFGIILQNLDTYSSDMYEILADVYSDRKFIMTQRPPRMNFRSVKHGGKYSVDNCSLARMWENGSAHSIIALSETTIEPASPDKKPFTFLNMCFPYKFR
jgi:hypothetical protein